MECSEELFEMVPSSPFYHRTTRHRSRVHSYHLEAYRSRTNAHILIQKPKDTMYKAQYTWNYVSNANWTINTKLTKLLTHVM